MGPSRSRNLTVFINLLASYILLQGIIYTALSVCAVLCFKCKLSTTYDLVGSFFTLVYFLNSECEYPGAPEYLRVTHHVSQRTYIISICYIFISILWILTSISVLARKSCSRHSFCSCIKPWMIIVLAGCILDIVATCFHVTDLVHTGGGLDLLEYLGLPVQEAGPNEFYEYLLIPSLVMTLCSTRLIVLWFINFLSICFLFKASRSMAPFQYPQGNSQSDNRHNPHNLTHQQLDRHTFEPLKGGDDSTNNNPDNSTYVRAAEDPNQNRHYVYPKSILINSKKDEPNSNEYSNKRNELKPIVAPKPIPVLKKQPSNLEHRPSSSQSEYRRDYSNRSNQRDSISRDEYDNDRPRSSVSPPDDLRSQLPWSYFHPKDKNHAIPKHVLAHAGPENPPFIPEPDYNVHSPKREGGTRDDRRVPPMEHSTRY